MIRSLDPPDIIWQRRIPWKEERFLYLVGATYVSKRSRTSGLFVVQSGIGSKEICYNMPQLVWILWDPCKKDKLSNASPLVSILIG